MRGRLPRISTNVRVSRQCRPLWQRLVVALTLVAFAVAGYATQTHIHPLPAASHVAGQTSPNKAPNKAPDRDDPAHCPFCQEYVIAGACITPAPIVLPLPIFAWIQTVVVAREVWSLVRFSHSWQGRAPPRI